MRRYARLFLTYLRVSVLGELEYRANLWVQVIESAASLVIAIGGLAVVFTHTDSLAGWDADQLLALVGVYTIIGGVIGMVIGPSMQQFMEDVRKGTFDFVLSKPADAQFMASARQFRVWKGVDVVLGVAVLAVALARLGQTVTLLQFLVALLVLGLGIVIVYSFWLMLGTLAFWVIRVDNLFEIFNAMFEAGRWPVTIYPQGLRLVLTFVVPVAFAVTVPAQAFIGRMTPALLIPAVVVALLLFGVARLFWRYGIRNYSGASA